MCPIYSKLKFNIKAFFVIGVEVEEIELPESWANLPQIDDHSPGPNMMGFLIIADGQEIYVWHCVAHLLSLAGLTGHSVLFSGDLSCF